MFYILIKLLYNPRFRCAQKIIIECRTTSNPSRPLLVFSWIPPSRHPTLSHNHPSWTFQFLPSALKQQKSRTVFGIILGFKRYQKKKTLNICSSLNMRRVYLQKQQCTTRIKEVNKRIRYKHQGMQRSATKLFHENILRRSFS